MPDLLRLLVHLLGDPGQVGPLEAVDRGCSPRLELLLELLLGRVSLYAGHALGKRRIYAHFVRLVRVDVRATDVFLVLHI